MGANANVAQTELTAISIAAKEITRRNITGNNIYILTDSRQALLALSRPRITSYLVLECHQALIEACNNNVVTLAWIKGHGKSKGNRTADSLAKKAASQKLLGPGTFISLSTSAVADLLKKHSLDKFKGRWDDVEGCKLAKELLQYPDSETAKKFMTMNRQNLRTATGILTGHCHLRKHLHRMGLSDTPLCRGCEQEDETVEHILCECPTLSQIRYFLFGEYRLTQANMRELPSGDVITYFKQVGWLTS